MRLWAAYACTVMRREPPEPGECVRGWWESFFDEQYVQAWTAAGSFTDTDQLVDDLDALLRLQAGSEILDIACGFGRVAGPLRLPQYHPLHRQVFARRRRLQTHNPLSFMKSQFVTPTD